MSMTILEKIFSPALPLSSTIPPDPASSSQTMLAQHLKEPNDKRSLQHFEEDLPLNTLDIMLQQESRSYRSQCLEGLDTAVGKDQSHVLAWFQKMIQFCYCVVDCCELPQEIVDVTINLLDRFLFDNYDTRIPPLELLSPSDSSSQLALLMSTRREILGSSSQFQLATMTCLYIASKLISTKCLKLEQLERLCTNAVTGREVESMELKILFQLQFQINPPTIVAVAQQYVQEEFQLWSFPVTEHAGCTEERHTEDQQRLLFLHLVEQQARLATCKLYTFHVPVSSIALACVRNALEVMCDPFMKSPIFQTAWLDLENKVQSYYYDDQRDIALVQEQLQSRLRVVTQEAMKYWTSLNQTNDNQPIHDADKDLSSSNCSASPPMANASSPTTVVSS